MGFFLKGFFFFFFFHKKVVVFHPLTMVAQIFPDFSFLFPTTAEHFSLLDFFEYSKWYISSVGTQNNQQRTPLKHQVFWGKRTIKIMFLFTVTQEHVP